MTKELPLQRIRELLRYDEETGHLYWKIVGGRRAKGDTAAGYLHRLSGYVKIKIDYNIYFAHRVIYALASSQTSFGFLDHINGDRSDNRLLNLREVSSAVNAQNNKVRGTFLDRGRWRSKIETNAKVTNLGSFNTEEEAHAAYLAAKKIYHPEARRN